MESSITRKPTIYLPQRQGTSLRRHNSGDENHFALASIKSSHPPEKSISVLNLDRQLSGCAKKNIKEFERESSESVVFVVSQVFDNTSDLLTISRHSSRNNNFSFDVENEKNLGDTLKVSSSTQALSQLVKKKKREDNQTFSSDESIKHLVKQQEDSRKTNILNSRTSYIKNLKSWEKGSKKLSCCIFECKTAYTPKLLPLKGDEVFLIERFRKYYGDPSKYLHEYFTVKYFGDNLIEAFNEIIHFKLACRSPFHRELVRNIKRTSVEQVNSLSLNNFSMKSLLYYTFPMASFFAKRPAQNVETLQSFKFVNSERKNCFWKKCLLFHQHRSSDTLDESHYTSTAFSSSSSSSFSSSASNSCFSLYDDNDCCSSSCCYSSSQVLDNDDDVYVHAVHSTSGEPKCLDNESNKGCSFLDSFDAKKSQSSSLCALDNLDKVHFTPEEASKLNTLRKNTDTTSLKKQSSISFLRHSSSVTSCKLNSPLNYFEVPSSSCYGESFNYLLDIVQRRLSMFHCKLLLPWRPNLQFQAASINLYGTEKFHRWVRHSVVTHMTEMEHVYAPFFSNRKYFNKYIREMSKHNTCGDMLTLRVLADCFKCSLHIITTTKETWYVKYDPQNDHGEANFPTRHLFFSFCPPLYYNAFAPVALYHPSRNNDTKAF